MRDCASARLLVLAACLAPLSGCRSCREPDQPDADRDLWSDADAQDADLADLEVERDADSDDAEVDLELDRDPEADAAPRPPCDVLSGAGCGQGERCDLYIAAGGRRLEVGCLPAGDLELGAGESCSWRAEPDLGMVDACAPGHACAVSECTRLCVSGDPAGCLAAFPDGEDRALDGLCVGGFEWSISMPIPGLRVCILPDGCDPFCQACGLDWSGAPRGCFPLDDGRAGAYACFDVVLTGDLAGNGLTGDPCVYINECRRGYFCFEAQCRAMCDLRLAPGSDGDADQDRDPGPGADGDADLDADAPAPAECEFSRCGSHEGAVEGTCQAPLDFRGQPFWPRVFVDAGVGLCLAE